MFKDLTTAELLHRFEHNRKIKLIGGPWGGKELPNLCPDEREIKVLHGGENFTYIKSDTQLAAYHLED
jgi:hypothetical protein